MGKLTLKYGKNGEFSHSIETTDLKHQQQQAIKKETETVDIPKYSYSITIKGLS